MRLSHILVIVYLVLCIASFLMSAGEGYWGRGSTLSLLLTLPWSLAMIFFAWTLIHDGARSLIVFLVPFAVLNSLLLYKSTNWWTNRRVNRRKDAV
jgi:hypothetical protein